jgi:dipeptidyl aminopeptidase/acylaminoacyl peptidase
MSLRGDYELTVAEVYPRQMAYGFQLAPNGQRLSFILQRDSQIERCPDGEHVKLKEVPLADIHLISSTGGWPLQLTGSGDFVNPAVWSPDSQWLAFERGEGLQIMPAEGGSPKTVYKGNLCPFRLELGDAFLSHPRWSPDGKYLAFIAQEGPDSALRLVSVDGRLLRELYSVKGRLIALDWSPDSRYLLVVYLDSNGWEGHIGRLSVDIGEFVQIGETENTCKYHKPVACWAPDGEHIVFRSNRSGWSKLMIARFDGGEARSLTEGVWDDYSYRFSPDGKHLVYASRASQAGNGDDLWMVPLARGTSSRLTQHPGINVPIGWSTDGRIYYWHSSPEEPGDLWAVSSIDAPPQRVTWTAPVTLERKLLRPQELSIGGDDGHRIAVLIYHPVYYREGDQYPAIIWIRGGPTSMCQYKFEPIYNWLANLGYIVMTLNYRGSVGYGVEYMNAVAGDGVGRCDLSDIIVAAKYAKALPCVDSTRGLGVGGRSWGGYLALMSVAAGTDLFGCAVADAAISDWLLQQAETEVRHYDYWLLGGWVYGQTERAKDRSPVNHLGSVGVPLLILHGKNDRDVPFSQAPRFVEQARKAGLSIEWVFFEGEGHSYKAPDNQKDALHRIKAFFARHLKPWDFHENPCGDQVL